MLPPEENELDYHGDAPPLISQLLSENNPHHLPPKEFSGFRTHFRCYIFHPAFLGLFFLSPKCLSILVIWSKLHSTLFCLYFPF